MGQVYVSLCKSEYINSHVRSYISIVVRKPFSGFWPGPTAIEDG